MRGENDAASFVDDASEHVPQVAAGVGVHASGGLVL